LTGCMDPLWFKYCHWIKRIKYCQLIDVKSILPTDYLAKFTTISNNFQTFKSHLHHSNNTV
jgi:hypothetical protein